MHNLIGALGMESPANRCSQLMTPTVVFRCSRGERLPTAKSGS
jgi:hypothetical protein